MITLVYRPQSPEKIIHEQGNLPDLLFLKKMFCLVMTDKTEGIDPKASIISTISLANPISDTF